MREPKVRAVNGLGVRLPGDARRRAAAVKTVDQRMALLEARRAAPTSHEVPAVAAPAPVSVPAADLRPEPTPTPTPRDTSVVEPAIDEAVRSESSIRKATGGTWIVFRTGGTGRSTSTRRMPRGSRSGGPLTAAGSRASGPPPVDALLYVLEPDSERARLAEYGPGGPGVITDLTERAAVVARVWEFGASDAAATGDFRHLMRYVNVPSMQRWLIRSRAYTEPFGDAMRIEAEAALREASTREHGDAPQV